MKRPNIKAALSAAAKATGKAARKTYGYAAPVASAALRTVFNGAVGAAGYLSENTLGKYISHKDDITYPTPPGVPLTAGETLLLKSIFAEHIDTDHVKKYFADKASPYVFAAVINAEKIKFYGTDNHSPDYSKTKDASNFWTFMYEMTHIWQLQHPKEDILRSLHNPTRKSGYTLARESRFQNFGVEQQASLIADYALQYLFTGEKPAASAPAGYYQPMENDDGKHQPLALLKKIVEDRFPQARKTRLTAEACEKQKGGQKNLNPGSF